MAIEFQLLLASYFPPAWRVLALVLLVAWFWPRLGNKFLAAIEHWGSRLAARTAVAAVLVGLLLAGARLALLPVERIPVPAVQDEFSYLLAGDTYASGRLTNPSHPLWVFFETAHVNVLPTYISKYPPAQGAALAIGELLGHPWFGVLLSVAGMCAAITWMLQRWMPARWAFLGGLLAAGRFLVGPVYAMNYWLESYWGGAVTALGGALALGALPRLIRRQKFADGVLLGIGIALLANSRPYEGLVFCVPLAAALAWWVLRRHPARAMRWKAMAPVAGVLAVTAAFMVYNNWRVTGNALLFPYVVNDRAYLSTPHFAWQSLEPPRPNLNPQLDAVFNGWCRRTWQRERFRLTWEGIRWGLLHKVEAVQEFYLPAAFMIPVALAWRRLLRNRKAVFLFFVCAWTVLGLVPVVWFQPHYAAALTAAAVGLSMMGLRYLHTWSPNGRPVGVAMTRALVIAHLCFVPMNILPIRLGRSIHTACPLWACDRAHIASELEAVPGPQLVLVRYAPNHDQNEEWVYNRADIDHAKVVWAREIPGVDSQPLLDYFRGRMVWILPVDVHPTKLHTYTEARAP